MAKGLVAFANSSEGRVFIGIEDDGKAVGVSICNELNSRVQMMARDCDPAIPVEPEVFNNELNHKGGERIITIIRHMLMHQESVLVIF